jgi:hypothetical protein
MARWGAKLIALACSPAPEGFARWSLRLLEEKVLELNIVEKASDNTIGSLKKNVVKPHRQRQWVIPPDANSGFVAAMEDVRETYQKPPDEEASRVAGDAFEVVAVNADSGLPRSRRRLKSNSPRGRALRGLGDPGLSEARPLGSKRVVGLGECGLLAAGLGGRRFSIVTGRRRCGKRSPPRPRRSV